MCEFSESEFIADLKRMHKYERQQEEEQKHAADCCCICCGKNIPVAKKSATDYVTAEELAGLDYRWRLTPLHNHQIENFKFMKSCSLVRNKPLNKAWRTFMDHLDDKRYPIILSSKKPMEFRNCKLQLKKKTAASNRMVLEGHHKIVECDWVPIPSIPDPSARGNPKDYQKKESISIHPEKKKKVEKNDMCCLFPSCACY